MPIARINDVNIHYESHGSGFPLVFVYGLGGNTGMWAGQIDAFAPHYRFITWDPRGHGKSDSPPHWKQYGLKIAAQDLNGLLDHLGIEQAFVGGLSMGGGIAATYAVAHPERVRALLIMDSNSASGLGQKPAMRAMREKSIELAETLGMQAVADYVIEANPNLKIQAAASPEARRDMCQMYLDLNPVGYANTIRTMLEEIFPTEKLATLKMPTLVLAGETDPSLDAARLTHSMIPGAEFVMLPDAGHTSNLDNPQAFNASVLAFLRQHEVPAA